MRVLNLLLVCTAFFLLLVLAFNAESPGSAVSSTTTPNPNPMKQNQEQFARIQPAYYAETAK